MVSIATKDKEEIVLSRMVVNKERKYTEIYIYGNQFTIIHKSAMFPYGTNAKQYIKGVIEPSIFSPEDEDFKIFSDEFKHQIVEKAVEEILSL